MFAYVYTVVFKIIAVCSKKRVKCKILIITFTSIQKCIGNIAHYILKTKHEEKFCKCVITLQKVQKRNIRLLKKIAVSAYFVTKSNIYCIN